MIRPFCAVSFRAGRSDVRFEYPMTARDPIQKLIPLDSPEEWTQALEGIPHGFCNTWEHCYGMHLTTGYPTFLYTLTNGDTRIICPITERPAGQYVEAVTPWGFPGFASNGEIPGFPLIWETFVRSRGYVTAYITLNPLFCRPSFTDQTITAAHNMLYVLDLTNSVQEIFQSFPRKRRQQLNKWEKSEVTIITDREILTRFFLENYPGFIRARGAPGAYIFAESTITFLMMLNAGYVIGAKTRSGLQSVLFSCFTPYAADALLFASLPEGREHMAGLMWHAARHFKSLGVPALNMGGGATIGDGIADFKRHFGTKGMPLRALRQIVRAPIYDDLCRTYGLSSDGEGYFPPYQRIAVKGYRHV
jgi:hypothetical protein